METEPSRYTPLRCRLLGHSYEHVYAYGAEDLGAKVVICRRRYCGHIDRTYVESIVAKMDALDGSPRRQGRRYLVTNRYPNRPEVGHAFTSDDRRHDFHTLFFALRRMRWCASQGYDAQVVDTWKPVEHLKVPREEGPR